MSFFKSAYNDPDEIKQPKFPQPEPSSTKEFWVQLLTEGTPGQHPPNGPVKMHYTGTLLDGTVFDSSVKRG